MTELAKKEILDLIAGGESDRVEFKEALSSASKKGIREAICAFANDLPGHGKPGYVLVGVRDDGTLAGIKVSDETLRTLADMRSSGHIVPLPSMSVRRIDLDGGQVAMITVQPSDYPPLRCDGNILIRTGSRRGMASAQDERILNEKRRANDTHYELRLVPGARFSDLSMTRFKEEYLARAFSKEVLVANERTEEEQLAALKMIESTDNPVPTVLGMLIIGKNPLFFLPGAYIQFIRFRGEKMTDEITYSLEISGPLQVVVDRLDDMFHAYNPVALEIGPPEKRTALYPMKALQELTRNAIMHRDYETSNAPVRMHWFNDRIEIINAGSPYGEVTGHLGEAGYADYRNPNLAAVMRDMGLVQRFGTGIQTARKALQEGGNPPLELYGDDSIVRATVYPSPRYKYGAT